MAGYKVAFIKVKKSAIGALTDTTAVTKNISTITGDTVTAITGISIIDLDGVNLAAAVSYTV